MKCKQTAEIQYWNVNKQLKSSTIEEVTEEILKLLAREKEYVAAFFTGPCNENAATDQECETVLHDLENIDDDLDDFMDLAGSFKAKAEEPEKEVKAEHKVVSKKQN